MRYSTCSGTPLSGTTCTQRTTGTSAAPSCSTGPTLRSLGKYISGFSQFVHRHLRIELICYSGVCSVWWFLPPAICEGFVFTRVCLSKGEGICPTACWDTPPLGRHPPWTESPPKADTPRADTPPAQCMQVNKRAVCIPVECNLISNLSTEGLKT